MAREVPSEFSEQSTLVNHLRNCGVYFFAIPNGGERSEEAANKAAREGVLAGASDLMIVDPPPIQPKANIESGIRCPGLFLEMKKVNGTIADCSDEQIAFLKAVQLRGYAAIVCFGARDAVRQLRAFGYKV